MGGVISVEFLLDELERDVANSLQIHEFSLGPKEPMLENWQIILSCSFSPHISTVEKSLSILIFKVKIQF